MLRTPPPEEVPEQFKASWSKSNQKIRRLNLEPLPALNDWPVTETDRLIHTKLKRSGPAFVDWPLRLKKVHNCPFLLPKYPQLIYHIITGTLKSGHWINRSHIKNVSGYCPCCTLPPDPNIPNPPAGNHTPATIKHMFSSCILTQDVWTEANTLGHTFWSNYTDFNYMQDITLLVHSYNPVNLFKLAVIWSLWRWWCKLFYESDSFDRDRLSNMTAEVMLMVRDEMIYRLIECRPVIQWLEVWEAAHRNVQGGEDDHREPEKQFLLVGSQSIITNPVDFDLPVDNIHVLAWLGNNTLCYLRAKKIVFNHANWFVFSSTANCVTDDYVDSQEDSDSQDDLGPPAAAFMMHDY
jgi:hypothetical protein